MKFINLPVKTELYEYHNLTDKIVRSYSQSPEIQDIYTLGSISNPGISDIDFLFVFRDDRTFNKDIRMDLNVREKYIMIHEPFGIPAKFFNRQLGQFSPSRLVCLTGNADNRNAKFWEEETDSAINKQTALEYLIKFYISQEIQSKLNLLKVRSFLLEIKALKIDFEILKSALDSNFNDTYLSLIEIRNNWFDKPACRKHINVLRKQFMLHFKLYLLEHLNSSEFCMPFESGFKYARNIKFSNSSSGLEMEYFGPGRIFSYTRYCTGLNFKLANKFSFYNFHFPWKYVSNKNDPVYVKFQQEKEIANYNKRHLPNFLSLKSSFNIFT